MTLDHHLAPHYPLVPKDPVENRDWRRWVTARGYENPTFAAAVRKLCSEDLLFFMNTFCWVFEPRPYPKKLPFNTYEYQDVAMIQMLDCLGRQDVGLEKSRDLGATWMFLTLFFHQLMFTPMAAFGLVSRNEDLVDKPEDPDCLMWKLDYLYRYIPRWLRPPIERSKLMMKNTQNGATIIGYAATGDVGRGGRKFAFGIDEYAAFRASDGYSVLGATQHATQCRIFVSTPKGPAGAYFDVMHETDTSLKKIVLDWKDHPERCRGLYSSERISDGSFELKILDAAYRFPKDYNFKLTGTTRSPYYDAEKLRPGATDQSIAAELDRNYGGSGYQFFDMELMRRRQHEMSREPVTTGRMAYDLEEFKPQFVASPNGPLRVWCPLDGRHQPNADHDYVVSCDISAGTAGEFSSNSVANVFDRNTNEQVAEYATRTERPTQFAQRVVAICKWFNNAYLIWESNGVGVSFGQEVNRIRYANIHYREVDVVGLHKRTRHPGFWVSEKNKESILNQFARAIGEQVLVVRAREVFAEAGDYVFKAGKVVHARSVHTTDESAKGYSHGDRVMSAALGWEALRKRVIQAPQKLVEEAPYGSPAWRDRNTEAGQRRHKEERVLTPDW